MSALVGDINVGSGRGLESLLDQGVQVAAKGELVTVINIDGNQVRGHRNNRSNCAAGSPRGPLGREASLILLRKQAWMWCRRAWAGSAPPAPCRNGFPARLMTFLSWSRSCLAFPMLFLQASIFRFSCHLQCSAPAAGLPAAGALAAHPRMR